MLSLNACHSWQITARQRNNTYTAFHWGPLVVRFDEQKGHNNKDIDLALSIFPSILCHSIANTLMFRNMTPYKVNIRELF